MICDNCGYKNPDTANSCSSCGAKTKQMSEQDLQRILDRATDTPELLVIKISTLDRINAAIAFISIPVLVFLLIMSSGDVIQFIGITLLSAIAGFIAISPKFAETMIKIKTFPYTYKNSGKAIRKILSWGFLATSIISTLIIYFSKALVRKGFTTFCLREQLYTECSNR